MNQFKKKQPVSYAAPYRNMEADISASIKLFTNKEGRPPNYILVNPDDYMHLFDAYKNTGAIPLKATELTIIQSARVMRTPDMPVGHYDVVSN